eukprot:6461565-Amphidinium_carterae.1
MTFRETVNAEGLMRQVLRPAPPCAMRAPMGCPAGAFGAVVFGCRQGRWVASGRAAPASSVSEAS